eukprot:CAMPEP_0197853012 /NCGR_PEP_ID=MMETSP1438-20131217/21932_1 /TAXON_ID=1461541 /ORGANISM="Pterosperma sp., Strain CCMP1384" /LENGTH=221 /DNA_ID=CAMNT_0043467275 /DNA_START=138 /DNA_END=803 /DNA_ORIENTATION=-
MDSDPIILSSMAAQEPELTADQVQAMYEYKVPVLAAGAACSLKKELAPEPFKLAEALGLTGDYSELTSHSETARLWRLKLVVDELAAATKADWVGVYRSTTSKSSGGPVLLKEAYIGRPSRAEFPLTEEFAKNSNNSTVGLFGKAVLVEDTKTYEGPYYMCDGEVRSEYCTPIVHPTSGAVLGIIDAEAFAPNHFTADVVKQIDSVCAGLASCGLMTPTPA